MIIALVPILLYSCSKDGEVRFWQKFVCTVNNVAYIDNPKWNGPLGRYSPKTIYYKLPDDNDYLDFSSTIKPKDEANNKLPVYIIDCGIKSFNLNRIGEQFSFTIPKKEDNDFTGKVSYFRILNCLTNEAFFGNGYMIITSYDKEGKKIYGKIKVDAICNNRTDDLLHIEGEFRSIIEITN